ncbi:discoidin domain-containing protein, partial [bacterium]|nr:discoidin domain-containing protein [bacterium]
VRADPAHPAYGLIARGVTNWSWERATYGDDMARVMLATIASAGLLHSDRWDEGVLKCLLGSLRTTGVLGFRHNRIDIPELEQNGWRHYFNEPSISYAPHYQAYLWACYLWAYQQTGYELFLERAKSAIRMTMEAYPDEWHWTNGIQQERARMLLPLAWLVRIEDKPEHRKWLRFMAGELLALQDDSYALREEIGDASKGSCVPPKSNEAYGTAETPLLQTNGDPVCDLLYTTNFAYLGLHEAAAATGDPYYKDAEDKLTQFLCRIQIESNVHPELDGGWYRAFDFDHWEYWASSADLGWGAWSIESGWTQGWIVAVLGMRQKQTSLWELTKDSTIEKHFDKLQPIFFPDGDQPEPVKKTSHDALGKSIQLNTDYSASYPGFGKNSLIDGLLADDVFPHSMWQGYHGDNVDAVIDLGEVTPIKKIQMRFLQRVESGIFLPSSVTFSHSVNGKKFEALPALKNDISQKEQGTFVHTFQVDLEKEIPARYIKVVAKNIHEIPEWHHAKGRPAWLFSDEVIVNPTEN